MFDFLREDTREPDPVAICTVYAGTLEDDPMRKLLADRLRAVTACVSQYDYLAVPKEFLRDLVLSYGTSDDDEFSFDVEDYVIGL